MAARSPVIQTVMNPLIVSLLAALFSVAAHGAPAASMPAGSPPVLPDGGAPQPDTTPRLAYGFLMKHGEKLVFAPCRDRSYALVEDVSSDRQVTRGLEMAGVADGRKYYVELLGVLDGGALRASELNLARAEGRCQKPGGSDEAWLASGNEPGWVLAAGGELVSFKRQGGGELKLPYRPFERRDNTASYSVQGEAGRLDIRFERKLCRDGMADAVTGWSAEVNVDGKTLRGCAWQR